MLCYIGVIGVLVCKNCLSEKVVKNGVIRGKQRYKCGGCGYNFVEGDKRTSDNVVAKKAVCAVLCSLSKPSISLLARIFDAWPSLVYRWIVETGVKLSDSELSGELGEMEFDEMLRFVGSKKANFDPTKQLTVVHGDLWSGCSAILILQHSNASATV